MQQEETESKINDIIAQRNVDAHEAFGATPTLTTDFQDTVDFAAMMGKAGLSASASSQQVEKVAALFFDKNYESLGIDKDDVETRAAFIEEATN